MDDDLDDGTRSDKFCFYPGDLEPITDPEELERIYRRTGVRPLPAEKQTWISEQWKARWRSEPTLTTRDLEQEYDQRKRDGTL
ncbi:MAG: hypothetical protein UHD09_09285 [Bifidobacterium sp.]|nr:hypothetical protein [Bifidobacterium sp.]